VSEEKRPSLKEVVVEGVGYVGAFEAWDLWRRLKNGGIDRMMNLTMSNGGWKTKVGAVGMMCTGAAGVLTGVGCLCTAIVSGHFMADVGHCWADILIGGAAASAGWLGLGIGHKIERQIEVTKAAAVLTVAVSPEPPMPALGVTSPEIDKAMAIITAPPQLETPVPPQMIARRTGL
jgi:hypothetical protein